MHKILHAPFQTRGVLKKISTGVLKLLFWFEIGQIVIFWVAENES